ncbi:MAG: hypothetical protein ACR2N5_00995, partial [Solirubrobacterales bacterium]
MPELGSAASAAAGRNGSGAEPCADCRYDANRPRPAARLPAPALVELQLAQAIPEGIALLGVV